MKEKLTNILLVLSVLIGLAITVYSCWYSWKGAVDFPQYYAAAKLYLTGQASDIYRPDVIFALERTYFPWLKEPALYCYPPPALPIMALLGFFEPRQFMVFWTVAGVLSFLVALFTLGRAFNIERKKLVWLFVVLSTSGPYCQVIMMGQPSFYMLLGLSLSIIFLYLGRQVPAALWLVLLLPKPHLILPFVVYFFGARKYKFVFSFALLGVVFLALSFLTAGKETFASYFEFLKWTSANPLIMKLQGCLTLRSQFYLFFPAAYQLITTISAVVSLIALAAIFYLGRRFAESPLSMHVALLLAMPIGLVTSMYFQPYDIFLLLPSLISLLWITASNELPAKLKLTCLYLSLVAYAIFFFPIYTALYFKEQPLNPYTILLILFAALGGWAVRYASSRSRAI